MNCCSFSVEITGLLGRFLLFLEGKVLKELLVTCESNLSKITIKKINFTCIYSIYCKFVVVDFCYFVCLFFNQLNLLHNYHTCSCTCKISFVLINSATQITFYIWWSIWLDIAVCERHGLKSWCILIYPRMWKTKLGNG